jgi:flagellar hook-associated protein 2
LLTDNTGQAVSNLRVQEVGSGQTAADLGLAGINVAAASAQGSDVLSLHADTDLASLNDGAGIDISDALEDLEVSLRDGTTLRIDFGDESTLGEILETINAVDPARLQAEIGPDGDRIVLTDLGADIGGTFAVTDPFGGDTAEALGLTGTAAGGVIAGARLLGGLKTSLLTSLGGGRGLELGLLNLTDRAGTAAAVDLSTDQRGRNGDHRPRE